MCPARLRRGFTITDLLAVLAVGGVVLGLTLPVLSGSRGLSHLQVSMGNLTSLGFAHAMYAADWNDRQYTVAADDLAQFGNTPTQALANFEQATGEAHPPLLLGWGAADDGGSGGIWGFYFWGGQNAEVVEAIDFDSGFGNFRMPNAKGFHDYVGGRFYDTIFYAPADTAAYETAEPFFDSIDQYVPSQVTGGIFWSSYCTSPAALYDHQVLRAPSAGGFIDPFEGVSGTASPPVSAAGYADLKTRMIEHHWNQGPPAECNPAFENGTYDGCEPYYFNMGLDSNPATLFFDGSVRVLPNEEVLIADQIVLDATNGLDGLWHRATPLGPDGYFIDAGFDGTPLSHHILTIDGILGRDTISMPAARRSRPGRQPGSANDFSDGNGLGLFMPMQDFVFAPAAPGSYSAAPDIREDVQ